jgi:AraC family transcriptional regulator
MEETTYGRWDSELNQCVIDRFATQDYPSAVPRVMRKRATSVRAEQSDSGTCRPPQAFMRVREHVDANLDSRLNVDALARIVGMSTSQFSRSFRKAVGLPPHTYVVRCRVMRARELLATTQLPLIEIALTIGFSDQAHFSRRFHEYTGVPPGVFRRLTGSVPR